MPGCIGSIDCTHWHWKWVKCSKPLGGQYLDRKRKRSVDIETVCDEYLELVRWVSQGLQRQERVGLLSIDSGRERGGLASTDV